MAIVIAGTFNSDFVIQQTGLLRKNFHHKRSLTHRNLLLWTTGNRKDDIRADSLALVHEDVLALAFNMYVQ